MHRLREGRMQMLLDTIIIGGGVSGCAVARELSRYQLSIALLEKGEDVCSGTSKANSAIVHAGFDAVPGTCKARLNVRGSQMMETLCGDLDVPYIRNGAMVVSTEQENSPALETLLARGAANGVSSLQILSGAEARRLEPNLSDEVKEALYAPTSAIVDPFLLNIGMAENAAQNGVQFYLNTEVTAVRPAGSGEGWEVCTSRGSFTARTVVNAAGVHADLFHNMVSAKKIHITPRRGCYQLLDRKDGGWVRHTIFPEPTRLGKGVLVTPTVHGNLLMGPTAVNIADGEDVATTAAELTDVVGKAGRNVRNLPLRDVITSFAGVRAHADGGDFVIGEAEDAPGFFDCAGIESPGLSASPAIGEEVAALIADRLKPARRENWIGKRTGILHPDSLTPEERNDLIRREPAYGRIICRCEKVTEGEILDAIHRPLGAVSLDGVKRRTRAGMGRCQSGFCMPRVMEILQRECGEPFETITKCGGASRIVLEKMKRN